MSAIFQTNVFQPGLQNTFNEQFWGDGKILLGAGFQFFTSSTGFISTSWEQNPGVVTDIIEWPLSLTPGDYNFTMFGDTDLDRGINVVHVTGLTAFFTMDWYSASFVPNVSFSTTVTIPEGVTTFHSETSGQNASSSGYLVRGIRFIFEKI